jgi:TIR domain
MAPRNDVDVFVSYQHDDRDRVSPIVGAMQHRGWDVWWDTHVHIGDRWRDVIADRLRHARAVCVVWTHSSIRSDWVLDEAESAKARGVLVPIRLDPIEQPMGFRGFQCADLADAVGAASALEGALDKIAGLVQGSTAVDAWPTRIDYSVQTAEAGLREGHHYLKRVRALADMFAANPGAAAGLQSALRGVRDTDEVVGEAIDAFLAPVTARGSLTVDVYRPLADGRLVKDIARRRGHCKRIAQLYVESGGLRDSLPSSVDGRMLEALDDLILDLSDADLDLFDSMASIGTALQTQAAVIVNLLLAGQEAEAAARLAAAEEVLLPLRQKVNAEIAEVERLASDLGVEL